MAQLTDIILTPIKPIDAGSTLEVILLDKELAKRSITKFEFVPKRVKNGQITLGANIDGTLKNFVDAVKIDAPLLFTGDIIKDKVKIGVLNPGFVVSDVISYNPIIQGPIFESEIIAVPWNPFKVTNVSFEQDNLDPCSYAKIRITTSSAMTSYCINQMCIQISSNVVEYRSLRGSVFEFRAVKNSSYDTRNIQVPSLLHEPLVNITNSPYGSTVSVNVPDSFGLQIKYSLDGVNWQNENVFSGLDIGGHTVYIKDQFGCNKSKGFTVLDNNFESKAVAFISKENSFRFKEPIGNYVNDENQFFSQSYNSINYCYEQDFLNTDIITTQFKTNYKNNVVKVTNISTNQISFIPIIKKTNNLGLKQKFSDVNKYKINGAQFGIYFRSGAILDYESNMPIENYHLNGSLPLCAKLGNFININGAYYEITSIGFDESVNAEVLIFNGFMSESFESVIVGCIYNLQEYDVFEFDLNFSIYPNSKIKIEIINSDPNFGEHIWESETLTSNELLKRYLEIRYYNSTNTNIVYSTGIRHLLRLPFNTIKAVDSDSSETYKTDTNAHLLDSKIYEITEFDFMPFPLELWRKLKIALSVDAVFIDGVGYSKNAEFTKESLGSSNLYKLTAQMLKNGFTFNSNLNSNEIIIQSPVTNIPGLIQNGSGGFIEY